MRAIPIRNVKLYWVILLAQAYILVSDLERTYVPKPDSASSMAVSQVHAEEVRREVVSRVFPRDVI